ncbi:MAG: hypothetical protein ACQ9MH_26640 [Nitrospinales bacterium]
MNKIQNGNQFPFIPAQNMSFLVNAEINEDGAYHPNLGGVTKGGMSNHYPMTIISLHELGATGEEIQNLKKIGLVIECFQ